MKIGKTMPAKPDSWDFVGGFGAQSRDMLAALLDQSVDCLKVLDPAGRIDFMNRNGRCTMEIDDFSAVAGRAWDQLWPEDQRPLVRGAIEAAQRGDASRFEAPCPTAKGVPKWWDVSVNPVRDGDDRTIAILSISRDITERRQALESMETLAHEMRHRLRNAFAVSGAIALASGRAEPEHADFAGVLAQRLSSLSAAQSSLIDPAGRERLPGLAVRLGEAFDGGRGLIDTSGVPDIELGEQAVRLIALVLGELSTNSFKHGALGASHMVSLTGEVAGGMLTLEWREQLAQRENGNQAAGDGSGQRLMARMATAHGGSFVVSIGQSELRARLVMPPER